MKITIELTGNQVDAVKSYHTELYEPTTKKDLTATIQEWVDGLFHDERCALSSHYYSDADRDLAAEKFGSTV